MPTLTTEQRLRESARMKAMYANNEAFREETKYRSRVAYWRKKGDPNPEERAKTYIVRPVYTEEERKERRKIWNKNFLASHPNYLNEYYHKNPNYKESLKRNYRKRYRENEEFRERQKAKSRERARRIKEQLNIITT